MFDPSKPFVFSGFYDKQGCYMQCIVQDGKKYWPSSKKPIEGDNGLEEPLPFQEPVEQIAKEQAEAAAIEAPRPKTPARKKPPVKKSKK